MHFSQRHSHQINLDEMIAQSFNVLKWKRCGMGVRLKCTEQGFGMKEKWKCVQSEHLMWKYWKTVPKNAGFEKCPE